MGLLWLCLKIFSLAKWSKTRQYCVLKVVLILCLWSGRSSWDNDLVTGGFIKENHGRTSGGDHSKAGGIENNGTAQGAVDHSRARDLVLQDWRPKVEPEDRRTKVDPRDRKKEVEQHKRGEGAEVQGGTRKSKATVRPEGWGTAVEPEGWEPRVCRVKAESGHSSEGRSGGQMS